MQAIVETLFDAAYLSTVVTLCQPSFQPSTNTSCKPFLAAQSSRSEVRGFSMRLLN